jgi:hypothetical protein
LESSSIDDTSPARIFRIKHSLGLRRVADYEDNFATPDILMASALRMNRPVATTLGCKQAASQGNIVSLLPTVRPWPFLEQSSARVSLLLTLRSWPLLEAKI